MRYVAVRISAGAFLLLAIVFVVGAFGLGIFSGGEPGPGLLPLSMGVLLLPMALTLLIRPGLGKDAEALRGRPLLALGLLTGYGVALAFGGFLLPTVAFAAIWSLGLYKRSMMVSLVFGIGLALGAAIVFIWAFGMYLPLWPKVL